jgi:glycosyltransferase involved in cell wall biosynthesis
MVKRTDATEQWLPVSARVELAGSAPRGEDLATFLEARIARAPAIEASLQPGDRIVVLTHALPPGGAERQWCYLACELRAMGYDVQFVTLLPLQDDDAHYLPLLEQGGVPIVRMDQWNGRTEGHRSLRHLLGRNSELRGLHESPFGLVVSDLIDALKTLRPKAVMAQLDYSNLVAGAASIAADVPHIVLSFRNYSPMRFSYLANEWYGPLYRALARSPRVHLTGNSTAGNLDYAEWLSLPRGRIELIPNAIDPAAMPVPSSDTMRELRSELSLSEGQPVILGVFRINEEKRPLLFVETCARVVERVPDVKVLMVGVGPMEDALRQRIDELGLASAVQLLGRREDVPALMAVASLLLLTSSFEGMPNVVMEAQLMGLPVVASRTGGTGDCMIDGETGYLVDVDDHAGYCERVLELLNDAGRRAAFGRRGEVLMRSEFSRRAMAERFLAMVNHVRHHESSAALEAAAGIVRAANS